MSRKLTWTQGETKPVTLTITSDGTTAVDTSSATCEFKVDSKSGTELLSLTQADSQITVGTGGDSNIITIDLTTADTNIAAGVHTWQATIVANSETLKYQGSVVVTEQI